MRRTSTGAKRQSIGGTKSKGSKRAKIVVVNLEEKRKAKCGGQVLTFGQGDVGQLGLGQDILERGRPSLVQGIEEIAEIVAGGMHTVLLTKIGDVFTFGCDDEGALGREATDEDSFEPKKVLLPRPAVQVTAGDSHSAALLEDGHVYIWGSFRDSHGAMGLTPQGIEKRPVQILPDVMVVKIASGSDHLVLLSKDGHLYTCGCAEQGQLGRVSDRFASRESRQGLSNLLLPGPVIFPRLKYEFVDVWASTSCTFAKERNNGIVVFGLNNYSQIGLPNKIPVFHPTLSESFDKSKNWVKITGGQHHTLCLDSEGRVYCLGRKEYGRLGLGEDCDDADTPTLIPHFTTDKFVDIACGSAVSLAVSDIGGLYAWGMGSNGQLGAGEDDSDSYEPRLVKGKQLEGRKTVGVAAGGQHTLALVVPQVPKGVNEARNK